MIEIEWVWSTSNVFSAFTLGYFQRVSQVEVLQLEYSIVDTKHGYNASLNGWYGKC